MNDQVHNVRHCYLRQVRLCFRRCLSVYLSVSNFAQNFRTDWHEIRREGWQWADEQMIKFWWRSGSPSLSGIVFRIRHYLDKTYTESGINQLRCATLQWKARHSNDDVITSPAHDRQPRQTCFGGGMHCPSASSLECIF